MKVSRSSGCTLECYAVHPVGGMFEMPHNGWGNIHDRAFGTPHLRRQESSSADHQEWHLLVRTESTMLAAAEAIGPA